MVVMIALTLDEVVARGQFLVQARREGQLGDLAHVRTGCTREHGGGLVILLSLRRGPVGERYGSWERFIR